MERTILRPQDVFEETGIPVETLRYWRYRGIGPRSYKLGRRVFYDRAELDRWLEEKRRQSGARSA